MQCRVCGKELGENENYCKNCGTKKEDNNTGKGLAIASLVLGIVSIVFSWPTIVIPFVGLILGICQKGKYSEKIVGIILNAISLFFAIILWGIIIAVGGRVVKEVIKECPNGECIHNIIDQFDKKFKNFEFVDVTSKDFYEMSNSLKEKLDTSTLGLDGYYQEVDGKSKYHTFNDGNYSYYEEDKEDKFSILIEGTYTVKTGNEELELAGYNINEINRLNEESNGLINIDNIFLVEINLTKVDLSLGSSTRIENKLQKRDTIKQIWVIMNHDEKGIEAQMYDYSSKQDDTFVKIVK